MREWIWMGSVAGCACVVLFVDGCAQPPNGARSATIESTRVVENGRIDFATPTSHAERFGLRAPARETNSDDAPAAQFSWHMPAGWTELPPATMRLANFRPAGDERAECYMTMLAGEAGGLTANINRWRGQLSLGPLAATDVEALPTAKLFGRDATLLECDGTWQGMSGSEGRANWALIGLLLVEPGGSVFLKMTGPKSVLTSEREAFLALAASISAPRATAESPANDAGPFRFETPSGWRRAPDRASRALTFWAGDGEAVECYVTVLGGEAGGELANINRWRGQVGLSPTDQSAVDGMKTILVLGRTAKIVELDGESSSVIGITCMGSAQSVFVKLTGPRERVNAERANMLAFAASLQESR